MRAFAYTKNSTLQTLIKSHQQSHQELESLHNTMSPSIEPNLWDGEQAPEPRRNVLAKARRGKVRYQYQQRYSAT